MAIISVKAAIQAILDECGAGGVGDGEEEKTEVAAKGGPLNVR